jgi:dynein heavy chain
MKPKELSPELPVVHITAVERKDLVNVGFYECPVYVTSMRGPTYVFTAKLKMESEEFDEKIWILAGVALLMAPE